MLTSVWKPVYSEVHVVYSSINHDSSNIKSIKWEPMSNIIPSEAQKQSYKYSSPQNKNTVIIYLPLTLKTRMTFLCLWNKKVFF